MQPVAVACLLLLGACARNGGGGTTTGTVTPVQAGLSISDDPENFEKGNTFNLSSTMALYLRVLEPTLPQVTTLSVTFTDPHGEAFHEDHAPYTTVTDQPMMVSGGMMPIPTQAWPVQVIPGGYSLIRSVPIRGTNFTRIPQPEGAWGISAELDGVPGVLTTTVLFSH